MTKSKNSNIWEGTAARAVAFAIIVLSVASLGYIHRNDLFPPQSKKPDTGLNPEFVKCRTARLGSVEKMKSDKIINAAQYAAFRSRALAFCTAKFPPRGQTGQGSRPPGRPPGLPQR